LRVWIPSSSPASLKNNASSTRNSPAGGGPGGGSGGFESLQKFFATPQGSSGGQSASPPPPLARIPQVATSREERAQESRLPPPIQPLLQEESKPVVQPAPTSQVAAPVPEIAAVPVPAVESEASHEPMAFFVAPERCWWCWWLMIVAGFLTAFILGFIVHRRRRAQRLAKGWTPHWQTSNSSGPE